MKLTLNITQEQLEALRQIGAIKAGESQETSLLTSTAEGVLAVGIHQLMEAPVDQERITLHLEALVQLESKAAVERANRVLQLRNLEAA
jgi:hypothetical protein